MHQELLSGDIPYGNKADPRIPSLILEGKLPDKPEDEHRSAFFHPLWAMCQVCWRRTPEERPSADKLFDILGQMATADSGMMIYINLRTFLPNFERFEDTFGRRLGIAYTAGA